MNPGMQSPTNPQAQATPTVEDADHIEKVATYFDVHAKSWSELYGRATTVNDLVLAARKDAAVGWLVKNLPQGARVLDAGCGAGLTAVDLIEKGFRVHGVDVSQKMLDHCRENFEKRGLPAERWELGRQDLIGTELPADSYDGIAALGFVQYQEDELRTLRALHRLLKPGGILVVTGPSKTRLANYFGLDRYWFALRRRVGRLLGRGKRPAPAPASAPAAPPAKKDLASQAKDHSLLRQISVHAYTPDRFRELLTGAGFEVLATKGHGFVNFSIIKPWLGFRGELFLHRFFTGLSRVLPISRFANDQIAVGRKR